MEDTSIDDTNSSFDLDLSNVGSSTPMNSSFLSPIKKFDNLNLNNLSDIHEDEDDIGNRTIETDSSEVEDFLTDKPVYVNKRKRANLSDIDMITPNSNSRTSSTNNEKDLMSVCSNSNSLAHIKLSFSNSDSTPCPLPAKKKHKFKNTEMQTPSSKKRLLNFSHSIKTNVNDMSYEFHEYHDYNESDHETNSPLEMFSAMNQQSTPISQSTPSNSRPASPDSSGDIHNEIPEAEGTPVPLLYSKESIKGYKLINKEVEYEIVEDITADLSDIHIADQRIIEEDTKDPRANDPYLKVPARDNKIELRLAYMKSSFQLPVLQEGQEINNDTLLAFYNYIRLKDESLLELLKSERLKWHPDKWMSKEADIQAINTVSQCLNSIIENL